MDLARQIKITLKKLENALWLQRYLERVETNARVLRTYYTGSLDHACFKGDENHPLLDLIGYSLHCTKPKAITDFQSLFQDLIFDSTIPASICYNLEKARFNGHLIRDLLSQEGWVGLNTFWLWFNEIRGDEEASQKLNFKFFLDEIIRQCQLFYGIIHSNQREDELFEFIRLGSLIEKGCQTVRLIDTTLIYTLQRQQPEEFSELLWPAMLETRSALDSFYRVYGHELKSMPIINFLLFDPHFPLSVEFCLHHLKQILDTLKNIPAFDNMEKSIKAISLTMKQIRPLLSLENVEGHTLLQPLVDKLYRQLNGIK